MGLLMKRFRVFNKGITLVELIVTIAVMTIVGGAITSFIVVAQRSYNSGSAETDLQYEAQMVVNQLQDLVIDTARGISYQYNDEAMSKSVYILDEADIPAEAVTSTRSLYIYDREVYYKLNWDPDTEEVRFFKYDKDGNLMPDIEAAGELLAEYVTSFSVDLRELAQNRTVTYVLTLSKDSVGKSYTTSHKIKLRNEILVNVDRGIIYVPDEIPAEINGIVVEPQLAYLWPGGSLDLSHKVTSSNGVIPSQAVAWEISEYKDAEGNVLNGVEVDAATDKLSASLDAINDADHKFAVVALKTITGQADPMRSNTAAVRLSGITGITATDDAGCISTNTAEQNVISEGKNVTATAKFDGYNLKKIDKNTGEEKDLTNADIGGAAITVTKGSEYIEQIVINQENGTISFKAKKGLDFSKQNYYYVTIHFQTKRNGFTDISCDMNYTIKQAGDFDIVVSDTGWKRNGYLSLDVENLNVPYIIKNSDGSYRMDKKKCDEAGVAFWVDITATFYYRDKEGNRHKIDSTQLGPNNSFYTDSPQLIPQGDHAVFNGAFVGNDLSKIQLKLMPIDYKTGFRFACSQPFYHFNYTDKNNGGNWLGDYWCVNEADITITYGANQSGAPAPAVSQSITVPIEEVSFGYKRFLTADAGEEWSDPDKNEYYTIFVDSSDTNKDKTYKIYYKMMTGWSNTQNDGEGYELSKDMFVGIIGDPKDQNRYYFKSIVPNKEKEKGENYYLEFTFSAADFKKVEVLKEDGTIEEKAKLDAGTEITCIYEYFPYFGSEEWKKASSIWVSEETKKKAAEMTGCPGGIKFVFVDPNVIAENVKAPVSSFCPDPDTLATLGNRYYYVSEEARFEINKDKNGSTYLIYEEKSNNTWSNPWNGRSLHWNEKTKKWVLNNVVITDTDNRTRPSVLYCLPFTQDHATDWIGGRFKYSISDTEYFELINYTTGKAEIKYFNTKDNSGWGDATLYWDTDQKVWMQYEDNVMYHTAWSTQKPSIAYCPSPDALKSESRNIKEQNGLYYYRFSTTEYYVYDPDINSIYYAKSSSSSSMQNMTAVWGANTKLIWDANNKQWSSEINVIITDDRTKPSRLYCIDPTTISQWQWANSYFGHDNYQYSYDKINDTEAYLIIKKSNVYYAYYVKRYNNYNSQYWYVWDRNTYLYWDATQRLWVH